MKVLYCGIYDEKYNRNRVFTEGLRQHGVEVVEVNGRFQKHPFLFVLREVYKKRNEADVILLGHSGYYVFKLGILLKLFIRKNIVTDPFYSIYDTFVYDRKIVSPRTSKSFYYWLIEWIFCFMVNGIILDTREHANYFIKTFKARKDKLYHIYIGANEAVFFPLNRENANETFLVNYHGGTIPLQGVQFIIEAAKILENEKVLFRLIGVSEAQEKNQDVRSAQNLHPKNISYIDYVPYESLPKYMNEADVCLGIFGGTPKSMRVVPNKIFEIIAMAVPSISGESEAMRELFVDKENILLCKMADAQDLANKIMFLKNNKELRDKIGAGGYRLFQSQLSSDILVRQLISILERFVRGNKNNIT